MLTSEEFEATLSKIRHGIDADYNKREALAAFDELQAENTRIDNLCKRFQTERNEAIERAEVAEAWLEKIVEPISKISTWSIRRAIQCLRNSGVSFRYTIQSLEAICDYLEQQERKTLERTARRSTNPEFSDEPPWEQEKPEDKYLEDVELEDISPEDELIEDGFGTASSPWCSNCGQKTMYVCRPGDIRCCNCYDNSPDMLKDGSLEGESGDGSK